jgi:hypothetical protein
MIDRARQIRERFAVNRSAGIEPENRGIPLD